jgi:hypothetical protein
MNEHRLWAVSLGVLSLALTQSSRGDDEVLALAARIDQRIAAAWNKDVVPAPIADDAEFFRRVHLDLAGRIPSVTEIRDFLDDDRPDKRRLWVDRILQADPDDLTYRDAYVNHFANVWRAWLLGQANQPAFNQQVVFNQRSFELWLQQRLRNNVGYDQLVRDLLTQELGIFFGGNPGKGKSRSDPTAIPFYLANEFRAENLAGSTARLFLGVSLECAQCHDHPFAKWSRSQFWEYAAFFTDVNRLARQNKSPAPLQPGEIKIMGTDKVVKARFLDGRQPTWQDDQTRTILAEWMTAADNPFFARAAVNRFWAYFFGAGLVQQLDGPLTLPSPPRGETINPGALSPRGGEGRVRGEENSVDHAALLDELAREFVAHNYDVKFLIRAITASQTYQRTSAVSDPTQKDTRLLARMPLRGLSPEQLFASLAVATENQDTAPVDPRASFFGPPSPRAQFLAKFPAQKQRADYQTSILQALYLMNSDFVAGQTSVQKNRTLATLAEQRTSTARKVESLYLVALSRKPRPEESERFVKFVASGGPAGEPKKALADVFWVLLNSPEFLLNH